MIADEPLSALDVSVQAYVLAFSEDSALSLASATFSSPTTCALCGRLLSVSTSCTQVR